MPRCLSCKRTGFTAEELDAHAEKFGHARADPADRVSALSELSLEEFEPSPTPSLSRNELLDAMKQLLSTEDLKAWLRQLLQESPDPTPPARNAKKGGTSNA